MDGLLQRVLAGDPAAIADLVRQHEAAVRLYAAKVAPRPDMAEDIAQKAFLEALKSMANFDPTRSFQFWMQGIVRNVARREWKRLAQQSGLERDGLAEYIEKLASSPEPVDDSAVSDRLDALRACLEKLPGKSREVVKLRYAMEMSCRDVSARLGLTIAAVKMSLLRVRGALRQCVKGRMQGGLQNG